MVEIPLRKEPFEGCMTTAEAAARCVAALEDDQALEAAVLAPLRLMAQQQAS